MDKVESSDLARALARMSAVLLSQENVATTVQLVTTLAVTTLPGTAGAGVSLMDTVDKRSTAASDPLVEQADLLQYELDEGPCLTAWRDRVPVRIDDTDAESRWPRWTKAVAADGIRAVLSTPMLVADRSIGAIKVYSRQPSSYDDHGAEVLTLLAKQAAILLANAQSFEDAQELTTQLKSALVSRDLVGQAKGVLIAGGARDEATAFAMLTTASQRSNVKVHEVARRLVADTADGRGVRRDRPRTRA
ncbi:MAG TPA: GAF and ANTAR domain-containing protein [Propionibacteriaceae bacterium]|nr:GAF and ANTAR domain-containing protein [Propionibacteriaceae bacterium]